MPSLAEIFGPSFSTAIEWLNAILTIIGILAIASSLYLWLRRAIPWVLAHFYFGAALARARQLAHNLEAVTDILLDANGLTTYIGLRLLAAVSILSSLVVASAIIPDPIARDTVLVALWLRLATIGGSAVIRLHIISNPDGFITREIDKIERHLRRSRGTISAQIHDELTETAASMRKAASLIKRAKRIQAGGLWPKVTEDAIASAASEAELTKIETPERAGSN